MSAAWGACRVNYVVAHLGGPKETNHFMRLLKVPLNNNNNLAQIQNFLNPYIFKRGQYILSLKLLKP